jgi:hypothetical protein
MRLPESSDGSVAPRDFARVGGAVRAALGSRCRRADLVLLLAGLLLAQPRAARAENSVSYKYEDYREAGGRVAVQAQYGLVEQDLGPDLHLKLQGVIDAIAGATPTGELPATPGGAVPLTQMHDRRKAWNAEFSRQFSRVNVALGFANSRESDYVSNGWSVNTLTDFNGKNTTLLLGVAGTDDDVKVFYQVPRERKRSTDLIAGVTQLLDPRTSVSVNLGYGGADGYLSDPYRAIQKTVELFPGFFVPRARLENRPRTRDKWTLQTGVNRAFPDLNGAVEASYRFYRDTFGTTAHTLELAWFQKVGPHLVLRPALRLYDQSAANFYYTTLDGTPIALATLPNPAGPFYSADYRLSALRSYNYGLKAIWTVNASWQLDAALEEYEMKGRDDITSPSAYPRATIATFGVKFSW